MIQSNTADARRWVPQVEDGTEPLYRRLADALRDEIAHGSLTAGARLPTQRALAKALGISVGTVNSAYIDAEQRGLVRRHVGRGTFVASTGTPSRQANGQINLATNLPPYHQAAHLIRALLGQLIEDADSSELLGYPRVGDNARYRAAAAAWIARTTSLGPITPQQLLPCQGATQGLTSALDLLLRPGDALVCEQVTYGGFKMIARQLQLKTVAASIDEQGMTPEGLQQAARESGAKAVILCPTLHNPTGATASLERRKQLIQVARDLGLWIIEDDVYGSLAPDKAPPPIAALAPDITFYVGSASKSIAPGLRAGWVIPPQSHFDDLAGLLNARTASVSPFGCPVLTAGAAPFGFLAFAKLCETRMADQIAEVIKRDAAARLAVARRVLDAHLCSTCTTHSLNLWLPMDPMQAESLYQLLAEQQIHLTPPCTPMVEAQPTGLRVCLGGPEKIEELEEALHVLAGELARADRGAGAWRP